MAKYLWKAKAGRERTGSAGAANTASTKNLALHKSTSRKGFTPYTVHPCYNGPRYNGNLVIPGRAHQPISPCYNGPRYNGNLVIPDALTNQSHLAITDKLKFWWSRYNGNLVLHVRYSEGGLYSPTVGHAERRRPQELATQCTSLGMGPFNHSGEPHWLLQPVGET